MTNGMYARCELPIANVDPLLPLCRLKAVQLDGWHTENSAQPGADGDYYPNVRAVCQGSSAMTCQKFSPMPTRVRLCKSVSRLQTIPLFIVGDCGCHRVLRQRSLG